MDIRQSYKKVLVAEPEEYLLAIYSYHLSQSDYFVKPCNDLSLLPGRILEFKPHLLLISGHMAGKFQTTASFIKAIRFKYPELLVVTVGHSPDTESMRHLMDAGVNAHMESKLTKPKDVVEIVKSLLINS